MSTEYEEKVTKKTKIYRKVGQGIKIFHEHQYPDVDILAVPGLGTNPEECWTWKADEREDASGPKASKASGTPDDVPTAPHSTTDKRHDFNWLRDKDGLAELFPKSRIMLYDYASAWTGNKKVRATMRSICSWLLDDLRGKRKGATEVTRPLIFIGHSMGGVVIAKTLCVARARKEFEAIVTCTVGCAFFGAPFRGSDLARIALLYSSVFGQDAYESLLSFMRSENNDALDEVTNDFMEISSKLAPPIELLCIWEQVPTSVSYSDRIAQSLPRLMQHKAFTSSARAVLDLGAMAFKTGTHFVDMESAVLPGAHSIGLTADHRDLIKFESVKSSKFGPLRSALSEMVKKAKTNARKRAFQLGQNLLTQKIVNQVRLSLEGENMRLKFRARVQQRQVNSWLTSEPLYQQWLVNGNAADQECLHLWLKGGAGLGKTDASLAAINDVTKMHLEDQHRDATPNQSETFLVYFLCDSTPGCCTAEDVLKNLITQIINQEESLAQHGARWFVSNPRQRVLMQDNRHGGDEESGGTGAKATVTVDNLWRCLLDMIDDPVVNNIYLIINNLHILEEGGSTTALLSKLREHTILLQAQPPASRKAKWLITSRNDSNISHYLTINSISIIDLDNDREYGAKVKDARRKHADEAVLQLQSSKKYSLDTAYYVRSSIESQSANKTWIEVLCILLGAKPDNSSSLTITNWLRQVGTYKIHRLIDHAWDTTLHQNGEAKEGLEELLRALTIAYEPPSLADLAVLTQINDHQTLTDLVRRCSPILEIGTSTEHEGKVVFTNPEFMDRLSARTHGQLDISQENPEKKLYHGMMALRCFVYIKTSYKPTVNRGRLANVAAGLMRTTTVTARVDESTNIVDLTAEDEEVEDVDTTSPQASALECSYPVKYLFRHLGAASPDVAHQLCENDPGFWGQESPLRNSWLKNFRARTTALKDLDIRGMSALHVAAGIGAEELVRILIDRNGKMSPSWTTKGGLTALHVAARNNHHKVVDTLIRAGADIEAGEGAAGTPLHLAALLGNCSIIALLIERKANVNASSQEIGPVINAAIRSGTVDAVKQIMDCDVRFDLDYTKCDAPLSLSARMSEPSLFQNILDTGRTKWLQNVKLLDQALVEAAENGRLESLRILLKFSPGYTYDTLERAIFAAACEKYWTSVNELLEFASRGSAQGDRGAARLDGPFYLAAISREERTDVLENIWIFANNTIAHDIIDFALYQATVMQKETTVRWLLETCGASPNATAETPSSLNVPPTNAPSSTDLGNALNAAANTGHAALVQLLLKKGADVDDGRGYALQLAASEGHTAVVQLLLDNGALPDRQVASSEELGFISSTALQAACENNRVDVVEALIQHGADANLGGGTSTNPITAATRGAHPEILQLLLEAPGIDVNVVGGEDRSTPLFNAAKYMSTDCVELLVQRGADINAPNAAGDTPLIVAASRGDKTCVDMLCNNGADVTYRSPQRGLAFDVAAGGLHPLTAHVLADRMGKTIEDYRENGLSELVVAKKDLAAANAELRDREADIEGLNATLAETREQLVIANRDIDAHQHDKQQLMSMSSLHGSQYESVGQQMKVIQLERAELQKQLDASKGQMQLANDSAARFKNLLDEERQTNAALRKRSAWASLQEEKQMALDMVQHEKQAALQASEIERRQRSQLEERIQRLQNDIQALRDELKSTRADTKEAIDLVQAEELQNKQLQSEIETLQANARDLEEAMASVQAAASRSKIVVQKSTPHELNATPGNEYFPPQTATPGSTNGFHLHGADEASSVPNRKLVGSPVGSPPVASPGTYSNPATSPRAPHPNVRSPGSQAEGFRTIHGQHRPDGSLGGYRTDRAGVKRMTSDSLYDVSIRNGSTGKERTSSKESLH